MSEWVSVDTIDVISKALEVAKADLSPSFYSGAKAVIDLIYNQAEQTEPQDVCPISITFSCKECGYGWWNGDEKKYECMLNRCPYTEQTEPQRNMAEDIVESFGFKAESYRQAKAKTEPQTEIKIEPTWVGTTYGRFEDEPQTERSE